MRNWLKCLRQNVLPIGRFVSCYGRDNDEDADDGGDGNGNPSKSPHRLLIIRQDVKCARSSL